MRLGELLIREGVIESEQLEEALSLSEQTQDRVGSSLVELGYLEIDTLARALSAQHRVPAVLAKHVEAIDPSVVALFPPRVASERHAIPLGFTQTTPRRLVVALRDPTTTPIEELAFAARARIDVGVAPEKLIRHCLAKYYGVGSAKKYIEVDAAEMRRSISSSPPPPARAPAPATPIEPPPPPVLEPPPLPVLEPPPVPRIDVPPAIVADDDSLPPEEGWDLVDAPPPIATAVSAPPGALMPVLDLEGAIDALENARSRDEVGDVLVTWLRSTYGIGLVLIVKDGLGMALGWKGYARDVYEGTIETISMPLGPASMLTSAYDRRVSFRGPPPEEGAPIHKKLWSQLRCDPPAEVLVTPIILSSRVVNILYTHGAKEGSLGETALEDAARIAASAATAYARLIRKR